MITVIFYNGVLFNIAQYIVFFVRDAQLSIYFSPLPKISHIFAFWVKKTKNILSYRVEVACYVAFEPNRLGLSAFVFFVINK